MNMKLPAKQRDARLAVQVTIVALPGTGLTSVFGTAEVFLKANEVSGRSVYDVRIVSAYPAETCPEIFSACSMKDISSVSHSIDTLLLAGDAAYRIDRLRPQFGVLTAWLRRHCSSVRRFGAVCAATFALAEAGLLRQKHVTTHWTRTDELASRFPETTVHPDRLYVKDGNCYTSAGGASSLDLALLLVEEDLGSQVALGVAKSLVLFLRRTGEQPQLSETLRAQKTPVGSINNLLIWMADHLGEDLSVSRLAKKVAMSPRNFARTFHRCVGKTPGQHVVDLRLEAAQRNLQQSALSIAEIAKMSGFSSVEALRRLFNKRFGVPPGSFRRPQGRARSGVPEIVLERCSPLQTNTGSLCTAH